jgi:hypothetical protein
MAGESAQRVFEDEHARRRQHIRRTRGSIVVAVGVAFALGWALSIFLLSLVLSMVESIGTDGGQTFSVHRPPSVVSLVLGGAFAVQVATLLLAPSRREVAWRKGAEGERIVGSALDALSSDGATSVLHDRKIPGSRANIDHIMVAPTGVFTVDAKRYSGRLEVRARGREIWIKGRNRSRLLEQGHRQAHVVAAVLARAGFGHVPVTPVLCFVDTQMPGIFAPRDVGGVVLATPRKLRKQLLGPEGVGLDASQRAIIAAALDSALRPADQVSARSGGSTKAAPKPNRPSQANLGRFPAPSPAEAVSTPTCNRCGESMVVRRRRSDGNQFYGCSAFPRCRQTRPLAEGTTPQP